MAGGKQALEQEKQPNLAKTGSVAQQSKVVTTTTKRTQNTKQSFAERVKNRNIPVPQPAESDEEGLPGSIVDLEKDIRTIETHKRPGSGHSSGQARNSKGFKEFTTETQVVTTTKVIRRVIQRPQSSSGVKQQAGVKFKTQSRESVETDSDSSSDSAEESDRTFSLEEKPDQQSEESDYGRYDDIEEKEVEDQAFRIYDARFKIPANSAV